MNSSRFTKPTEARIRHGGGNLVGELRAVLSHLRLIYVLSWREIVARHKQSALGAGLIFAQPLMMLIVFTFVFGAVAKIDTGGVPYPMFALSGLLPWIFLQRSIVNGGISLVSFGGIFSKVYAPRLVAPLTAIMSSAFDFIIALVLLEIVALYYGFLPGWGLLLLPVAILYGCFIALALSLGAAALNVEYRDVRHLVPYAMQGLMYFSPVAYPTKEVPEGLLRTIFELNPVAGYLDFFRYVTLGTPLPDLPSLMISLGLTTLLFFASLLYFVRVARTFADRL